MKCRIDDNGQYEHAPECPDFVEPPVICGWAGCPTCDPEGAALDTWTPSVAGKATSPDPADSKHGDLFDRVVYEEKRSEVVLAANSFVTACAGSLEPVPPSIAKEFGVLIEAIGVLRAEAVEVAEG